MVFQKYSPVMVYIGNVLHRFLVWMCAPQLLTWEGHQTLKNLAEVCHQRWIYEVCYSILLFILLHGPSLMRSPPKYCIYELSCFYHSLPARTQLSETETLSQIDLSSFSVSPHNWYTFGGCDGLLCNTISFSSTCCCLDSPTLFPLYFFSPLSILLLPINLSVRNSLSLSRPVLFVSLLQIKAKW